MTGDQRLRAALARLARRRPPAPSLSLEPGNAWEVAVAQRLAAMQSELDRLRSQLNWLFTLVVGAAVTNVVVSLLK